MCKPKPDIKAPAKPVDLRTLQESIPKHCWERSFVTSFAYLLEDVLLSLIATAVYITIVPATCPSGFFQATAWIFAQLLWFWVQGVIWTGLWVVAHECGHHAFCTNDAVSDFIGWVIHSALLVPFFSWQYTHGRHHKNNNHLLDNETHVPVTRSGFKKSFEKLAHTLGEDGFAIFQIVAHLFFGWPAYIIIGLTGCRRTPNGKRVKGFHTHFFPNNNAFHKNYPSWKVYASTFGVGGMLYLLYSWAQVRGWSEVVRMYVGPYIVVNLWLVLYTWLHHTDTQIPQYGEGDWTWLKGAKSTIDRNYGIYDFFHHHIGSTHVCHHIFSQIPHYHAEEATIHLKRALGAEYFCSDENWMLSLWRVSKECLFVESVDGVQYYKGYDDIRTKRE
jgi:omega-6 fatty acid desaturase (delta-12 desaturase)